jgi:hypothetical protein
MSNDLRALLPDKPRHVPEDVREASAKAPAAHDAVAQEASAADARNLGPIGASGAPVRSARGLPWRTPSGTVHAARAVLSSGSSDGSSMSGMPLRVRGLDRVRLHADLTILAKLACVPSRRRVADHATDSFAAVNVVEDLANQAKVGHTR